jgi:hypothetical protein
MRRLLLTVSLVLAACSSGPAAPDVGVVAQACSEQICLDYPQEWEVDQGADYLAFHHPDAPERAVATAGFLNMEAVVGAAGEAWPATTETVVRSFWLLLEEAGVAEFAALERLPGGSYRSMGSYEEGRLWHLLVPLSSTRAVAVEVRGPNRSWDGHADIFLEGVTVSG